MPISAASVLGSRVVFGLLAKKKTVGVLLPAFGDRTER